MDLSRLNCPLSSDLAIPFLRCDAEVNPCVIRDAKGAVAALILHQDGRDLPAIKK